jgi:hypothetical protein
VSGQIHVPAALPAGDSRIVLTKKNKLGLFGNRALRKFLGPQEEETVGGWIKLRNEELLEFQSSPNIVTGMTGQGVRLGGCL